jgi:hypothetical protein
MHVFTSEILLLYDQCTFTQWKPVIEQCIQMCAFKIFAHHISNAIGIGFAATADGFKLPAEISSPGGRG